MSGVTQRTLVLRVPDAERDGLRRKLEGGPFDFRPVPHALFSARGEGVVATLYRSGKLVVQGPEPELFAARWVGATAVPVPSERAHQDRAGILDDVALVGSDESGKGDFFGPLVVAAVRLEAGDAAALRQGGVGDSKRLADQTVRRLAPALRARFPHAEVVLEPGEYNAEHARLGNLNPLLAGLHARAIRAVAVPGVRVLVDRFANERLMRDALAGLEVDLEQRPRAESEMAVAAASILARDRFLEGLAALSGEAAVDLPKGAGDAVDRAARAYVALHGPAALGQVAKLHFRNAAKLAARPS